MKKTICVFMCLLFVSVCIGCSGNNSISFPESGKSDYIAIPEGPYTCRKADWEVYNDAEKLISAADIVFIGKITGIEFQVLDITNGLPPSESTPEQERELYTIYSVEVITSYKGETNDISKVRVMGGMVDYNVDEQINAMNEGQAFRRESGIPIWDHFYKVQCENNKCYLFVLKQFGTGYPTILNLEQSVYNMEEPTRKHVIGISDTVYYSGKKDKAGRPIISAHDIISAFGSEKLKSFYKSWEEGKYNNK